MIKRLIMAALVASALCMAMPQPAFAQQTPKREYTAITNAATYVQTVPSLESGSLSAVNVWRCNPTNATLTVKQVYTLGAITVTSTVATVSGDLSGNGSAAVTNAWLKPDDRILYQFGSATTGTVSTVRQVPL